MIGLLSLQYLLLIGLQQLGHQLALVVDVAGAANSHGKLAGGIAARYGLHQYPAVLAIVAAQAVFVLQGLAAGQSSTPGYL